MFIGWTFTVPLNVLPSPGVPAYVMVRSVVVGLQAPTNFLIGYGTGHIVCRVLPFACTCKLCSILREGTNGVADGPGDVADQMPLSRHGAISCQSWHQRQNDRTTEHPNTSFLIVPSPSIPHALFVQVDLVLQGGQNGGPGFCTAIHLQASSNKIALHIPGKLDLSRNVSVR